MKPTIIAITGPSCSGKDTLMHKIFLEFCAAQIFLSIFPDVFYIISTTTRPPRSGEINHKDYHFISDEKFQELIDRDCFLEWTEFRNWKYGTDKLNLTYTDGGINIGVFNLQGIKTLNKQEDFNVIPIYLIVDWKTRLIRSIKREKKISFEMIRRLITDYKDFKHPYEILGANDNLLCYTDDYKIEDVMRDILGRIK